VRRRYKTPPRWRANQSFSFSRWTPVFQLVQWYTSGEVSEKRIISKPVGGTVQIYENGVLQTSGVTVDTTTGIVTFATAPGSGVAVSAVCE
jgi:uncharacterized protein (TIGR02217 family)